MRIPKSITVLGKDYPILKVNNPDNSDSGWIENDIIHINTCNIDKAREDEDTLYTLAHELGHAIFRRAGFIQSIEPKVEELVVDMFARVFIEVFSMKFRSKKIVPLG